MTARRRSTALVTVRAPTAPLPAMPTVSMADLMAALLAGKAETTRLAYDGDLIALAGFLGLPSAVAALDYMRQAGPGPANLILLRWREAMTAAGLAVATRNRRLSAVRAAFRVGQTIGVCEWAPTVPGERAERYRDTAGPGHTAYLRMLDAAGPRDAAILRLLHDLGLRRAELCRLDVADYDPAHEPPRLTILGKGRKEEETLSLPQPTADALNVYLMARGAAPGPLFLSDSVRMRRPDGRLTGGGVRHIVDAVRRAAGIDRRVRPHGLRHAGITRGLEVTGGDIAAVQRFSRHKDVRTVVLYDDRRKDLAGEVAKKVAER